MLKEVALCIIFGERIQGGELLNADADNTCDCQIWDLIRKWKLKGASAAGGGGGQKGQLSLY